MIVPEECMLCIRASSHTVYEHSGKENYCKKKKKIIPQHIKTYYSRFVSAFKHVFILLQ